jgi:hypothetical protein
LNFEYALLPLITEPLKVWKLFRFLLIVSIIFLILSQKLSLTLYIAIYINIEHKIKLRGIYFASELYRPNDRRLSAKLVPTFADRGCRVVSATDPHGC